MSDEIAEIPPEKRNIAAVARLMGWTRQHLSAHFNIHPEDMREHAITNARVASSPNFIKFGEASPRPPQNVARQAGSPADSSRPAPLERLQEWYVEEASSSFRLAGAWIVCPLQAREASFYSLARLSANLISCQGRS